MVGHIASLLTGLALVFAARKRPDGTALIPVQGWMFSVCPAICLAFLAVGLAPIVAGV